MYSMQPQIYCSAHFIPVSVLASLAAISACAAGWQEHRTHTRTYTCMFMHACVCVCVCVWRLTWTMQITPPCAYSNCLFVDMATCRLTVFTRCRSIINTRVYPAYTYMGGECRVVWLAIPYFLPPITRGRVIRQDSEPD